MIGDEDGKMDKFLAARTWLKGRGRRRDEELLLLLPPLIDAIRNVKGGELTKLFEII